jgi:hypothetical protein
MFSSIFNRRCVPVIAATVAGIALGAPGSALATGQQHRSVQPTIANPVRDTVSGSIKLIAAGVAPNAGRVLFSVDGHPVSSSDPRKSRDRRSAAINTRKLRNGGHVLVLEVFYANRHKKIVKKKIVVTNPPPTAPTPAPAPAVSATVSSSGVGVSGPPAGGVPGVSPTTFNRETYQFSTSLTIGQEASRYQTIVLAASDYALVPQLQAMNPSLKILMYQAIMETNANDYSYMPTVTGCTAYASDAASHASWILHDQNGNPVLSRGTTDHYIMDVGSAGYQQACATNAAALANKYGFDGIFFDMVQGVLSWSTNNGVRVPEYPNPTAWSNAMTSAISYLGPALRAQGLEVFGNVSGAPTTSVWEQWVGSLNGVEEESFTDGGLGLAQQVPFWPAKFAELNWAQANGKYEIAHSWNQSQAGNTFGLAAMMLSTNGKASYSTSNSNYTSNENWFPEYTPAQALGAAAGPYKVLTNGVYERVFSKGIVLVNPTGKAIPSFPLGGVYSGSGLNNVSTVTMSPTDGLILQVG